MNLVIEVYEAHSRNMKTCSHKLIEEVCEWTGPVVFVLFVPYLCSHQASVLLTLDGPIVEPSTIPFGALESTTFIVINFQR